MTLVSTRDAYGEALAVLGEKNKNIVVLDADMSAATRTCLFAKKFPERFFDMGIAEQDMLATAAGFAVCNKIPFVSTFAVFAAGRAWEQIRYSVAYPNLSVKIVATHGGISVGEDGASHQALEDIAVMRCLPNMNIVVPADAIEARNIIEACMEIVGPFYIRMSRLKTPVVFEEGHECEIGKAEVIRDGSDATIITCGLMLYNSLQAANVLEEDGFDIGVVNAHTIKPFDSNSVAKLARKTGVVITCEEHSVIGGLGSAVAEVLAENCSAKLKRIGINDCFGESGSAEKLFEKYNLTSECVVKTVKNIMRYTK